MQWCESKFQKKVTVALRVLERSRIITTTTTTTTMFKLAIVVPFSGQEARQKTGFYNLCAGCYKVVHCSGVEEPRTGPTSLLDPKMSFRFPLTTSSAFWGTSCRISLSFQKSPQDSSKAAEAI